MSRWKRFLFSRLQTIGLLVLSIFLVSIYVLGWSSLLTVKQVQVQGAPTKSDATQISQSVNVGQKLARLDSRNLVANLKKYSWLKTANISRNWFKGEVTIRVTARAPIAIVGDKFIDQQGVNFSLPHMDRYNVPRILADTQDAKIFAVNLIASLPISFRSKVEVASVEGLQSATLLIKRFVHNEISELSVRWGDSSSTSLKLRVYHSLLALPENARIVFMDLSAPHAPIVR